jgi:hypothetical protein
MAHAVTFLLRAINPVAPRIEDHIPEQPSQPVHLEAHEHLTWWFTTHDDEVEAHYLFDDAYVNAHPEALDRGHLTLLHALITFKLFDDTQVLIPPRQLAGVLRWPAIDERRRPIGSTRKT